MIDQIPIYALCYGLGWLPIYQWYRWFELNASFDLSLGRVLFSWFSLYYLGYLLLEIVRGYYLMYVCHELLVSDIDLFLGLILFLGGLFWPLFTSRSSVVPIAMVLMGVYLYLMPMIGWIFPFILLGLLSVGISIFWSYGMAIVLMMILVIGFGANWWYVIFNVLLLGMVLVKLYSSRRIYLSDIIKKSS